jgi:thymidylate kinase
MHVAMREGWTDGRLDEFEKRIDERFDRVDERFDDVNEKFKQVDKRLETIDAKLEKVDERLFSMGRTMVIAAIGMSSTMVAGFGALFALIAAKR